MFASRNLVTILSYLKDITLGGGDTILGDTP